MTDEEIKRRFDEGSDHFEEIRAGLAAINKKLETLPQLEKDIQAAKESSDHAKDLIEAWNALKTGGEFVRWMAPVVGAIVGAFVAVKGYFR